VRKTCPPVRRRLALVALLALLATAPSLATAADPPLLYLPAEAAQAVHDGVGGGTLRQAPIVPNPRWPAARSVGKVSGRELATAGAGTIAARLRAGWRQPGVGGLVAVDEISPAQWTPARAAALAAAMGSLGGDAGRVVFYAAPSLVERVGRTDPRHALDPTLAALIDAMSRGRATYLLTYRGDLSAFPPREMATHPTRWLARWPAGRGELRLMLGVDGGIGQAELWARARSTAAGRQMLANGPGAYGLRDAAAGRAWAEQLRSFRASPTVSVSGGDYPVPAPGGLTLSAAGAGRVRLTITRPGRAVVTVTPRAGGKVRAIRKLAGPTPGGVVVRLPADTRPGVYRVSAVLIGDGLRDRASVIVRVARR
jgi:hypothetical protein